MIPLGKIIRVGKFPKVKRTGDHKASSSALPTRLMDYDCLMLTSPSHIVHDNDRYISRRSTGANIISPI